MRGPVSQRVVRCQLRVLGGAARGGVPVPGGPRGGRQARLLASAPGPLHPQPLRAILHVPRPGQHRGVLLCSWPRGLSPTLQTPNHNNYYYHNHNYNYTTTTTQR